MPAAWRQSADLSRRALASLWDPELGVYVVSSTVRTGLLMDNFEVLSALETAARAAPARADRASLLRGAARLRRAITRVFWNPRTRSYRVSTQTPVSAARFYPEIVAQVFPAAFAYGSPARSSKSLVAQWLRRHERDWVAQEDSAAWSLVAVAAVRTGHRSAVACWLERAERIRSGPNWNVTDEAIYRALGVTSGCQREQRAGAR
jgi:hypothetical protein